MYRARRGRLLGAVASLLLATAAGQLLRRAKCACPRPARATAPPTTAVSTLRRLAGTGGVGVRQRPPGGEPGGAAGPDRQSGEGDDRLSDPEALPVERRTGRVHDQHHRDPGAGRGAGTAEHQSTVAVGAGEQLTERQLLEALLIPSGNNIARILAAQVAGSETSFVAEMNAEAARSG